MKIDIYPHILPPPLLKAIAKYASAEYPATKAMEPLLAAIPTLSDLDIRFRIMDQYPDMVQVLTLSGPPMESLGDGKRAAELSRIANDAMAELVQKYPYRFVAAVAGLPMNDMDAALKEVDRVVKDLHFRGVQVFSNINGKPLDEPEFMPLYEKMASYNLPIWIHPRRDLSVADYSTETKSKYWITSVFGWPYETTAAMTRLVFSGVFDRYPNLKFITHHCGAMVPYFARRIDTQYDYAEARWRVKFRQAMTKPIIEYFRGFYGDTCLNGATQALMLGYQFFGADHILFATDMPYDSTIGFGVVRETIESVERMEISDADKKKIFEDNARRLLRLPV